MLNGFSLENGDKFVTARVGDSILIEWMIKDGKL